MVDSYGALAIRNGATTNMIATTRRSGPNAFRMRPSLQSLRHQWLERPERKRDQHRVERRQDPYPHYRARLLPQRREEPGRAPYTSIHHPDGEPLMTKRPLL